VLRSLSIEQLRVYATVHNIYNFTSYTGYDPEVATSDGVLGGGVDDSAYPRSKGFVVGVNLTF
jgi:hypothetical protein